MAVLRARIEGMLSNPIIESADMYKTETDGNRKLLIKAVSATFVAAVTLPGTVIIDRIFMMQQKITNRYHKGADEESETVLIARAGLHLFFNAMDERQVRSPRDLRVISV